ncbi:hypothetical protein [Chlamydiifrater volucris]|uniref:hypothetical protein n=1 Tax=Chlamydiifrater volucris TaxID=2681470 RepID=UPI001BCCAC9D|nr:hypothetical protein [Chlamydiifrater volucris]
MSVSRSCGTESLEQRGNFPSSLSSRILSNIQLIREITESPPFFPASPDFNTEKEILRSQLFSIAARGYNYSLVAEAMAVSGVYMKVMLQENTALTRAQFYSILSGCRDLSEASGSSSQPPPSIPIVVPELETSEEQESMEELQVLETLATKRSKPSEIEEVPEESLLPHTDLTIVTETGWQEREASNLPLKKRKTWQLLLPPQQKQPSEETIHPQTSFEAPEEDLFRKTSSFFVLLDAIVKNKRRIPPFKIPCPNGGREQQHVCSICMLSHHIMSSESSRTLSQQLETLLLHTTKEALVGALISLTEEGKMTSLYDKKVFTRLEVARIAAKCNMGDAICLPGVRNPAEEVTLYESMERVIKGGLQHPLTQTIKELWESSTPVPKMDPSILMEEHENKFSLVAPSSLVPIFSSLTLRCCYHGKRKDRRTPLFPSYATFVAKLTILSLQAIKASPQGIKYLTKTSFNWTAFQKETVAHVYCLILASNDSWNIEVLPTVLSVTPKQVLSFSTEDMIRMTPSLANFVRINGVPRPQGIRLAFVSQTATEELQEPSTSRLSSVDQEPQKKKRKTHHVEEAEYVEESTSLRTSEISTTSGETGSQESTLASLRTPLSFLMNFILQTKGRRMSLVDCPNSSGPTSGHTCSLCLLAKGIIQRQSFLLIKQLERFLNYTTMDKLIQALINVFSSDLLTELPERHSLTNVEMATIIRDCGIGDEIVLPGGKNPASQVDLYLAMEHIVSSGLREPLTATILELWKTHSPTSPLQSKEPLSVIIKKKDGSIGTCQKSLLQPLFTPISQRYFVRKGERFSRGKTIEVMSKKSSAFVAKVTIATLKALEKSQLGAPYLVSSPLGSVFPWRVVEHIFSLILAANASWKVVVLPSQISPRSAQDLSLTQEEIAEVLPALQRFTRLNKIFLSGKSPFVRRGPEEAEEEEED